MSDARAKPSIDDADKSDLSDLPAGKSASSDPEIHSGTHEAQSRPRRRPSAEKFWTHPVIETESPATISPSLPTISPVAYPQIGRPASCEYNPSTIPHPYFNSRDKQGNSREIRVWVSSLQLDGTWPSQVALKQLLYGDPQNSVRGADIIAIFLSMLSFNKSQVWQVDNLRRLLRTCLDEPDDYVFNEGLKGHGIAGIPALLVSDEKNRYVAMYVCVHKSLLVDSDQSGTYELADTFPMPPLLTCGAPTGGEQAQQYDYSKSAIMQHILVKAPLGRRPLHICFCGLNLSREYGAQEMQLDQLRRHIEFYRTERSPFTVVFVGDTSHHIVCGEEFADYVSATKPSPRYMDDGQHYFQPVPSKLLKRKKSSDQDKHSYYLTRAGVKKLCEHLSDPTQRNFLFHHDSAHFTGKDCFGNMHKTPPLCARKFQQLFELNTARKFEPKGMEAPLPPYKRVATDVEWSRVLGFNVVIPELITKDMLLRGLTALEDPRGIGQDLLGLYYPEDGELQPRKMKESLGHALYLQTGWLDGIGLYKHGTCPARLDAWLTHDDIYAFDHVPISGYVTLEPEGMRQLGVWVGCIKLDNLYPSKNALRQLLYGSKAKSASGADVIALYLTDLDVHPGTVGALQNLLHDTLLEDERHLYVFNEQEDGLVLKRIPAHLMQMGAATEKPRYVALWICVKKELVGDVKEDCWVDAFPVPPHLICRTDRKNITSPSFKGHIAQTVMIKRSDHDGWLRLLLVGLNFDTADDVRARQVQRLQRHIQYHFTDQGQPSFYFAAVVFGDFNNRLVSPEWLSPHINFDNTSEPVPQVTEEGAKQMCSIFADPVKRMELMRSTDSWVFNGKDAVGKDIVVPEACSELRRLFTLHFDICKDAPLPTYKRTPLGEILGQKLGFKVQVRELVTREQLVIGLSNLIKLRGCETFEWDLLAHINREYFCDDVCQIRVPQDEFVFQEFEDGNEGHSCTSSSVAQCDEDDDRDLGHRCAAVIDCGWPDRVGVLKDGVQVKAEIVFWGFCEDLRGALKHAPVRGSIRIGPDARSMYMTN